jgi:hypothetical protein
MAVAAASDHYAPKSSHFSPERRSREQTSKLVARSIKVRSFG